MSNKKKNHKKPKGACTGRKLAFDKSGNSVEQYFTKPCVYVNSKPACIGTAVFLKDSNESKFIYKTRLRTLIEAKHRFLIVGHNGLKNNTVAVCLLSTSSYLNEEKELGIKLSNTYTNFYKDVYLDMTNCWIINKDCIKSIAYEITDEDRAKLLNGLLIFMRYKFNATKGLVDDEAVANDMDYYSNYIFKIAHNEDCDRVLFEARGDLVHEYIGEMTREEIFEYLENYDEDEINEIGQGLMERRTYNSSDIDEKSYYLARDIVANLMLRHGDFNKISDQMTRGYGSVLNSKK